MEKLRWKMVCSAHPFIFVAGLSTSLEDALLIATCFVKLIHKLIFLRNRGELAEGWYEPATLRKAQASAAASSAPAGLPTSRRTQPHRKIGGDADESSDDDVVGPALPSDQSAAQQARNKSGPLMPNLDDLELQRGMHIIICHFKNLWSRCDLSKLSKYL